MQAGRSGAGRRRAGGAGGDEDGARGDRGGRWRGARCRGRCGRDGGGGAGADGAGRRSTAPQRITASGAPQQRTRRDEREDLRAVRERHALGLDAARAEAVARRHAAGRRTARENLSELVDEGTFVEYGPLLFAAQERRRPREELIARTPADGLVGGVGDVQGRPCVVMSYDYMVLAGTQGSEGPPKKDRLFEIAERRRLPVVLLAEGGGGRPGDVDWPMVAGLDCRAFHLFGRLSGTVPLVGVVAGNCFAGNAALSGVLRCGDRHRGLEHRDGRPGDDRGWRLGCARARRGGADRGSGRQRGRGHPGCRRARGDCGGKRYLSYFNGPPPSSRCPIRARWHI